MIYVTINLPDNQEIKLELPRGSAGEIIAACKLIYPQWSSIVITITRRPQEDNLNVQA